MIKAIDENPIKAFSAKERSEIYFNVAEFIEESINSDENFICHYLGYSIKAYPEFLLFEPVVREFVGSAWFSESSLLGCTPTKDEIVEANKARIICLLFCSQMAKDE